MQLQEGSRISTDKGCFFLEDDLQSTQARVFKATDSKKRACVLKFPHPAYPNTVFQELFRREEAVNRELQGLPGIVAAQETILCSLGEETIPALLFPYVAAKDFGHAVKELPYAQRAEKTLHYAFQIAQSLAHIHRNHYVHADLAPANILVNSKEQSYIIDFGTSYHVDMAPTSYTRPFFASPEMRRHLAFCKSPKPLMATDIYSLGMIILRTNALCISANTDDFIQEPNYRKEFIEDTLEDLPGALRGICSLCLSERPEDRPNADELSSMLQQYSFQ